MKPTDINHACRVAGDGGTVSAVTDRAEMGPMLRPDAPEYKPGRSARARAKTQLAVDISAPAGCHPVSRKSPRPVT